jgi:hypothetical protein
VSVAAFALETDRPAPIAITQESVMSESNFLIIGFPSCFRWLRSAPIAQRQTANYLIPAQHTVA